jgi:glutaconyl-CoA/methylmalonyl-CoA decarboxylase subunit gamma
MADVDPRPVLVRTRPGSGRADDPTFEFAAPDLGVLDDPAAAAAVRPGNGASIRIVEVVVDGWRFELEVEDARQAALRAKARRASSDVASRGPVEVRAIIPGRVVSVDVEVGDEVKAGRHLLVLEAMKMQNELQAPADGRIARVAVSAGLTVDRGDLLVVIEPKPAEGAG